MRERQSKRRNRIPPNTTASTLDESHLPGETWWPFLLLVVTLAAYSSLWHAGYIWDDDFYVTENSTLRNLDGLRRIWFEAGAIPQYYPLVHTVFWVEAHLWGLDPFGFHLVNVLLHALNALLLTRVLQHLRIPGAWLAGFVFAVHPVHVETAAWVTELKNTLSGALYLGSALVYLRFADRRDAEQSQGFPWRLYALALCLFAGAMASKTVACSLPAALLLIRWWRTGRIRSTDVVPLIPFFVLGVVLGLQTVWIEKHQVGASGAAWSLSMIERCLIAGRALWFYAYKLLLPFNLTFIYPRWQIDASIWWQWTFPLGAVAVVVALWLLRERLGRGPLTAVLFFAGTLMPALGFIDVYPMRYSFVADHFQYLASAGLITLAVASARRWLIESARVPGRIAPIVAALLVVTLAILTWQQGRIYADAETLWRATIARNPDCSMAYNNLGTLLLRRGQVEEAQRNFELARDSDPGSSEVYDGLGTVALDRGRVDEALAYFQQARTLGSNRPGTYYNLGSALLAKGRFQEAQAQFEAALERDPRYAWAHNNLGLALLRQGQDDDAARHFEEAIRLHPEFAEAYNNLGIVRFQAVRLVEAGGLYRKALEYRPDNLDACNNLSHVAWLLSTCPDDFLRDGSRAVEFAQAADRACGAKQPTVVRSLAAAYAEVGRFGEASTTIERAAQAAGGQGNSELANEIDRQRTSYRAQQPYRLPQACTNR